MDSSDFILRMIDQTTGPATQARAAVAAYGVQLEALAAAQRIAGSGSIELNDKIKATQTAIDSLKSSMPACIAAEKSMTDAAEAAKKAQAKANQAYSDGQAKITALGGAYMVALQAAVAFVVGIVGAVGALAGLALSLSGAQQGFERAMGAAAGSAGKGRALSEAIDRIAASSSRSREELQGWGKSLAVAGLSGSLFEKTLKAMATAAAVVGPEAAGQIQSIVDKAAALGHFDVAPKALKGLGISMADLAGQMGMSVKQMEAAMKAGKISTEQGVAAMDAAVQARFGGGAKAAAMSFGAQMMKLKESFTKLFEGVDIKPFLVGLKSLLSMFDSNSSSMKALKVLITQVFGGLLGAAGGAMAKLAPIAKAVFQGMVIAALQLYIAIKQAIGGMGGVSNPIGKWLTAKNAIEAGKVAFKAVAVAVGVVVAVLAVAAASAAAMAAIVLVGVALIVAAFALVAYGVFSFVRGFMVIPAAAKAAFSAAKAAVVSFIQGAIGYFAPLVGLIKAKFAAVVAAIKGAFSGLSLGEIATNLINSFINGISSLVGKVVAAMMAMGGAAKKGLFAALGIASPSKIGTDAGKNVGNSLAAGGESTIPTVAKAADKMGKAATPTPGPVGAAKGGGGGPMFNFTNCNFGGSTKETIRSWMHEVFDEEIAAGRQPAGAAP